MPLKDFVVVYDESTGKAVKVEEFPESSPEAVKLFGKLQQENQGNRHIQINLVGAQDRADLEKRWKRWFR